MERKFDFFIVMKMLFKMLTVGVVLLVVGLFAWRFFVSRVPNDLLVLSPNQALAQLYAEQGDEVVLLKQEQNTTTRAEASYGYFTVCQAVYIPDIDQLQVLIRYNDSTLEATEKDYGLAEKSLSSDRDWYDISLLVMVDKTPENKDDNLLKDLGEHRDAIGLERILPTEVTATRHTELHNYRRLVFDGIDPTAAETLAVFLDFYFVEDIPYLAEDFDVYTTDAYGTLCLYTYMEREQDVTYSLSQKDIAAIKSYAAEK